MSVYPDPINLTFLVQNFRKGKMAKKPKFHNLHYNFTAKRIREEYPVEAGRNEARTAVTIVALNFAQHFAEDNVDFDPYKFLDACSPDTDIFPLSELWDDHLESINS